MVEIVLKKRIAKAGEIGLFCDAEPFREEWESLKLDTEIKAECTTPANLKYLRFFWALAGKVADNSPEEFLDKQDAADRILIAARHCKMIHDRLRDKAEVRAKSISGLSGDTWIRLLRRVTHVVLTQYLPGVEESELKAEIEKMIGIDVFAAPPEKKPHPKGGEPSAPPAAEKQTPAPAAERSGPQTSAEYIAACRGWLKKQTDHKVALEYYDSAAQVALRATVKLSVGENRMLRREIAEHFEKGK